MGLEAALIAVTVASGVVQAMGAYQQGKAQKAAAEYNAAVARQEGEIAQRQAKIAISQSEDEARRFRARQESLYAKAGVEFSGSPAYVITDTAAEYKFDQEVLRYNAAVGVSRAESQARYDEFVGEQYYREGLFKAGTSLLTTGMSLGQQAFYGRLFKDQATAVPTKK